MLYLAPRDFWRLTHREFTNLLDEHVASAAPPLFDPGDMDAIRDLERRLKQGEQNGS